MNREDVERSKSNDEIGNNASNERILVGKEARKEERRGIGWFAGVEG